MIAIVVFSTALTTEAKNAQPSRGDAPPGAAASLTVQAAKAQLVAAERQVAWFCPGLCVRQFHPTTFRVRSTGIQVEGDGFERIVWSLHQDSYVEASKNSGKYVVDLRRLFQKRAPASGGIWVFDSEATARQFADALNRLILASWKNELQSADNEEFDRFRAMAKTWREAAVKPALTDEADRHRILAENAIAEKNPQSALNHYESGLESDPLWPQGWYNAAVLSAELKNYDDAADDMRHYLEMMPDAPDAKAAREQMIIWQDKAQQEATADAAPQPFVQKGHKLGPVPSVK